MELIPILSLIILAATISTFILAVGAYILYKARERKGITARVPQPAAISAELMAPAPIVAEQRTGQQERRTFESGSPQQGYGYEYQRQPSYAPSDEMTRGPELRPTYVGSAPSQTESRYQRQTGEGMRNTDAEKYTGKKKYMRYTNEGYVEPSRQEKKQEDNLRWR